MQYLWITVEVEDKGSFVSNVFLIHYMLQFQVDIKVNKIGKKEEIKIVNESNFNYTGLSDIQKSDVNDPDKRNSNMQKDLSRKIRHKNRIVGGKNKQGHSSVYE